MMLAASAAEKLAVGDATLLALLGYAVVFFGLILLMCVIMIMGKIFIAKANKAKAAAAATAPVAAAPAAPAAKPAPRHRRRAEAL